MSGDGYTFLGYPDGTYAAAAHSHAGADVTSGTVAYGRLPVGTAASTVAAGDDIRLRGSGTIPADRGLIAWVFPPFALGSGSALTTAGTLYLTRIPRIPPVSVTNLHVAVVTQGSTLTSGQCFGALYTAAGTLIGQTADQATAWASVGAKTMALTGGPYSITAGDHYIGLWFNGTTGPSLLRGGSVSVAISNMGTAAPNLAHCSANTGLTTTAPAPFGAQTGHGMQWWVGVS